MKALAILLFFAFSSCYPGTALKTPEEGRCVLYMRLSEQRPIPSIGFSIEGIWLEGEGGKRAVLAPVTVFVEARSLQGRQILLAKGPVKEGRYGRLCLRIGEAHIIGREGRKGLSLPEREVCWEIDVSIRRGRTVPLFLQWSPLSSLRGGEFLPALMVRGSRGGLRKLLLFASNPLQDRVTVIDCGVPEVIATVDVSAGPMGMALSANRQTLYVACHHANRLEVIDVMSHRVSESVSLGAGLGPTELLYLRRNGYLYITMRESNSVVVLDPLSKSILQVIEVGKGPWGIATDPEERFVYVACSLSDEVFVIDPFGQRVVGRIAVGGEPRYLVADRRYLYVSNYRTSTVALVDRSTLRRVASIYCPLRPGRMAAGPMRVYVAGEGSADLSLLDPLVRTVVRRIPVGGGPAGLALDRRRKILYVGLSSEGVVRAVDLVKERERAEVEVGKGVYCLLLVGE